MIETLYLHGDSFRVVNRRLRANEDKISPTFSRYRCLHPPELLLTQLKHRDRQRISQIEIRRGPRRVRCGRERSRFVYIHRSIARKVETAMGALSSNTVLEGWNVWYVNLGKQRWQNRRSRRALVSVFEPLISRCLRDCVQLQPSDFSQREQQRSFGRFTYHSLVKSIAASDSILARASTRRRGICDRANCLSERLRVFLIPSGAYCCSVLDGERSWRTVDRVVVVVMVDNGEEVGVYGAYSQYT